MQAREITIRNAATLPSTAVAWIAFAMLLIFGLCLWVLGAWSGKSFPVGDQTGGVLEMSRTRTELTPPSGARVAKVIVRPGDIVSVGQPVAKLDWSTAHAMLSRDQTRLAILNRAVLCLGDGPFFGQVSPVPFSTLEGNDNVVPRCQFLNNTLLAKSWQIQRQMAELGQQYKLVGRASNLMLRDLNHPDGARWAKADLRASLNVALSRSEISNRLRTEMAPLIAQWTELRNDRLSQIAALNIAIAGLRRRIKSRSTMMQNPFLRASAVGTIAPTEGGSQSMPVSVVMQGPPRFTLATTAMLRHANGGLGNRVFLSLARRPSSRPVADTRYIASTVSDPVVAANGAAQYRATPEAPSPLAAFLAAQYEPGADGVIRAAVKVASLSEPVSMPMAITTSLCSFKPTFFPVCQMDDDQPDRQGM